MAEAATTSAWARWVARVVMRRPLAIIVFALTVGIIAFAFVQKLTINQQLRALLPDDFPSVVHLEQLEQRIVNPTDLYLTIRSPSREANIAYGKQLAAELRKREDIRYVIFHQDPAYFRDNLLLYADLHDLLDLRKRVIDGIQEQVRRETSMFGDDDDDGSSPTALDELSEDKIRERYNLDTKFSEYYETDEGRLVVVRARPTRPHIDFAFTTRIVGEVETLVRDLKPETFHPDIEVKVAGSYVDHAHSIENGVVGGTAISLVLLILILALYFRGARAIPMVLVPLILAALVALAIAQQAYGELNLVSAFMFAVLLGLGIDFMVHILARYRDERVRRGLEQQDALARALSTTGMSTLTGALSTALAFAVLSVVDFRGISQFGVIASIGVLLTYVGAIFVMPAMAVLIERVRPWTPKPGAATQSIEEESVDTKAESPKGFRPLVTITALVLIVGATVAGAFVGQNVEFEYDLNEIDAQPDPLTDEQMARKEQYRRAVGSASTTAPAVALTNDLDQSREAYRQLRALLDMSPKAFTAFTGLPSLRPTHAPGDDDPFLAHAGGVGSANLGLDEDDDPKQPVPEDKIDGNGEDEDDEFDDDSMYEEEPRFVELATRAEQLKKLDPEVAEQLRAYGPERLQIMHDRIIDVASIHAFVPEHQELKLEVIRDIRKWIDRKRGAFKGEAEKQLAEWEPYLKVDKPITIAGLPEWVRVQFQDAHGELGKFVVIWSRGTKADYRESQYIYRGFISLQTSSGEVPVAADYFVITEVFDTLKADGPVVVGLALIALVVSVTVLFRSIAAPVVVLLTVVCALIWLTGIMAIQGWKFHFLNIIALPLLIGMGQDDAIHLLHRNHELRSIRGALYKTGGVLVFTTVTTQIGFGGMLVVNHPGLSSLGWVAVVGMLLCLIASVTIVPALLSAGELLRLRFGQSRKVSPLGKNSASR